MEADSAHLLVLNFIADFNNITQFILSTIAAGAFFYFFSAKYVAPLRYLLTPLGLSSWLILRILLLCRKRPKDLIRAFCEFSIFKTQGQYHSKQRWEEIFHEFSIIIQKDAGQGEYFLEEANCSALIADGTPQHIANYFQYFDGLDIRRRFGLPLDGPVSMVMKIKFMQGFLMPQILLSGLLDRYKNNWNRLVDKYIATSTIEEADSAVYSVELFNTFAWLLWGPSYQLQHQDDHFKICQFAFGDESNSIHVIIKNDDIIDSLWAAITKSSNGTACSLICSIYAPKHYINHHRESFNPLNTYFLNKIQTASSHFLLEVSDYQIASGYKANNYYCTAYVWIMFESISEEKKHFLPQRALTFFEHANMASKQSYEACIRALISKCFVHFDHIFSIETNTAKYRYCLSMNKEIEHIFLREIESKFKAENPLHAKYRQCIDPKSVHSETVVFSAFDSFFDDSIDSSSFTEVSLNNSNSLSLLADFYANIYLRSFPNPNERETLDSILDYLQRKDQGWYGRNNFHVLIAHSPNGTEGGIIFDYLDLSNCGVVEFIAVKEGNQSAGLGTKLFRKALEYLTVDARMNSKPGPDYIFCEVETITHPILSRKDLAFWSKMGFQKLQFEYTQPALSDSKQSVHSLDLAVLVVSAMQSDRTSIAAPKLAQFLVDYARFAMSIESPTENQEVDSMLQQLEHCNNGRINLTNMVKQIGDHRRGK